MVEKKNSPNSFLNNKYSDELLNDLDNLKNWPNKVKVMQSNWIGKSVGADRFYSEKDTNIKVFTTRPDTIFGATFLALSSEHDLVVKMLKNNNELQKFIKSCENLNSDKVKRGFDIGLKVDHPFILGKKLRSMLLILF